MTVLVHLLVLTAVTGDNNLGRFALSDSNAQDGMNSARISGSLDKAKIAADYVRKFYGQVMNQGGAGASATTWAWGNLGSALLNLGIELESTQAEMAFARAAGAYRTSLRKMLELRRDATKNQQLVRNQEREIMRNIGSLVTSCLGRLRAKQIEKLGCRNWVQAANNEVKRFVSAAARKQDRAHRRPNAASRSTLKPKLKSRSRSKSRAQEVEEDGLASAVDELGDDDDDEDEDDSSDVEDEDDSSDVADEGDDEEDGDEHGAVNDSTAWGLPFDLTALLPWLDMDKAHLVSDVVTGDGDGGGNSGGRHNPHKEGYGTGRGALEVKTSGREIARVLHEFDDEPYGRLYGRVALLPHRSRDARGGAINFENASASDMRAALGRERAAMRRALTSRGARVLEAARRLRSALVDARFDEKQIRIRMNVDGLAPFDVAQWGMNSNGAYRDRVSDDERDLCAYFTRLFIVGRPVRAAPLLAAVGPEAFRVLTGKLGLLWRPLNKFARPDDSPVLSESEEDGANADREDDDEVSDELELNENAMVQSRVQLSPVGKDTLVVSDFPFITSTSDLEPVMYIGADSRGLVWGAPRHPAAHSVLDLCTGSGVQGVAAAHMYADRVTMVDFNPRAVRFARFNLLLNGLYDRGAVFLGDLYNALPEGGRGPFSVILANPPYIPTPESDHQNAAYGDGGPDGERIFRRIVQEAPDHLTHRGRLAIVSNLMNPHRFEEKAQRWWRSEERAKNTDFAAFHLIQGRTWSVREYVMTNEVSTHANEAAVRALEREGIEKVSTGFLFVFRNGPFVRHAQENTFSLHHDVNYVWGGLASARDDIPWVRHLRRKYWSLGLDSLDEGDYIVDGKGDPKPETKDRWNSKRSKNTKTNGRSSKKTKKRKRAKKKKTQATVDVRGNVG